ncbi:MAG: elongation factor P maturation arginine rhamnosyltransferase EarP [Limnobacter sp.]|nr:elongation factor P maturation arginine rhamnosyltransferase EarP [Limnobacter sp.]
MPTARRSPPPNPKHNAPPDQPNTPFPRIFVFCYPGTPANAAENALEKALLPHQTMAVPTRNTHSPTPKKVWLPFCPITAFDARLNQFDFLFVRGEDSFVRAQLAGKPFVWHIYHTPDNAHIEKLQAFFELYAQGLGATAKKALWQLWLHWNGLEDQTHLAQRWLKVCSHHRELHSHAQTWAVKMRQGPELAHEILAWFKRLDIAC